MSILSTQINEFKDNINGYMASNDANLNAVFDSIDEVKDGISGFVPLSTAQYGFEEIRVYNPTDLNVYGQLRLNPYGGEILNSSGNGLRVNGVAIGIRRNGTICNLNATSGLATTDYISQNYMPCSGTIVKTAINRFAVAPDGWHSFIDCSYKATSTLTGTITTVYGSDYTNNREFSICAGGNNASKYGLYMEAKYKDPDTSQYYRHRMGIDENDIYINRGWELSPTKCYINAPSGLATTDYLSSKYVPLTSNSTVMRTVSNSNSYYAETLAPGDITISCTQNNYSTRLSMNGNGAYLKRVSPAGDTGWCNLNAPSGLATTDWISGQVSGKADTSTVTAHTSDSTIHVTSTEKTTWNGKIDMPSGGTTGQVLKKTASGTEWADGGSAGDVTKAYVDAQDAALSSAISSYQMPYIWYDEEATTVNLNEHEVINHISVSATNYVLPAVTNYDVSHECVLDLLVQNTGITFTCADVETNVTWLKTVTFAEDEKYRIISFYNNRWYVMPIKLSPLS